MLIFSSDSANRSSDHPLMRMRTTRYRAKKKIVRGLWIATGILMLAFPMVHFIVTLGLFTTFLSFTILDEAP
ncbi:MAG: hypothetical protein V7707_08980 [Motiliproteus sp.]